MELLEREEPLALLASACRSAGRGRGGVVLVTGEPGIGKTALVNSFTATLTAGRVLRGSCDDLATPRPLGPLRDLVGSVARPLAEALTGGAPRTEIHDRLLAELRAGPAPTVLLLEDVHWADDATIDVITTVGRRIGGQPALLVLTFRDGELGPDHPLRSALAALPAESVTRLPLAPLSSGAVRALFGADGDRVHALTGGNPFYVTELLSGDAGSLPLSVAAAVQGRVATLSAGPRALLDLVSVVPTRIGTDVLDLVRPDWAEAAEEPERRGLLEVGLEHVGFRHELARTAIESGLLAATRRRLHREVLGALQRLGADPADLVHHAEAAGDPDALAEVALPAARRAATVEANREAYAHYRRALRFADRLPDAERAALFEELAAVAYLVDRIPEALSAIDAAAICHEATGERAAVGRCARVRSRLRWYAGEGDAARAEAARAVDLLEPLGESAELARACSQRSQLAVLGGRWEEAREWGRRAADMAERLGATATQAHAMVNVGTAESSYDPEDTAMLEAAHVVADACGERHEAVRALINNAWTQLLWVRPAAARAAAERARAYAETHEVDNLGTYVTVTLAWLRVRQGDWAAATIAEDRLAQGPTVTQLLAKTVLAEVAVRRGAPDAGERLADVAAQADRTHEMQRVQPVLELQIEAALISGAQLPVDAIERAVALARNTGDDRWGGGRLSGWAKLAGVDTGLPGRFPAPHAAMVVGDWAAAADAFGAVGWPYDRALMLSLLDDRAALGEALETARRLGAAPLAERVRRRLRELGLPVPHGPRETTRGNPLGLTERQLEVLRLVAAGLTNAEIADRLVVSQRTAEHHVEAVLAKLDASTRRDAARRAVALGMLSS